MFVCFGDADKNKEIYAQGTADDDLTFPTSAASTPPPTGGMSFDLLLQRRRVIIYC